MPVIDIKNGQFVEQPVKTKASAAQTASAPAVETEAGTNIWLNILTSKFHLILIGIIILLGYLLYRSYKSE